MAARSFPDGVLQQAERKLRKWLSSIREIAGQRGKEYEALGQLASLHQSADSGPLNAAVTRLAAQRGIRCQRRTGLAGAIVKLAFPGIKRSTQSRYVKNLKFARSQQLGGKKLAKHLRESGGIDQFESAARIRRRREFIDLAKADLTKQKSFGEFEFAGERPKTPRWVPMLGRLHPSGKVTVHMVCGDKRATVNRLLESRGRELSNAKTGMS